MLDVGNKDLRHHENAFKLVFILFVLSFYMGRGGGGGCGGQTTGTRIYNSKRLLMNFRATLLTRTQIIRNETCIFVFCKFVQKQNCAFLCYNKSFLPFWVLCEHF